MKINNMIFFIIAAAMMILSTNALGQKKSKQFDKLFNDLVSQEKLNGNVLIAEKGKVIYNKSFGLANQKTNAKLNKNSVFELASCSKQFTAMGILILSEKGKLNLKDEISNFFPELSFYKGVTVEQMVYHTSGLPDYMELMEKVYDKSKIATNADIIACLAKHQPPLLFEPNDRFEYSNTGYALLASIIEKTSGQSFGDFLSQSIFQPLKMKNSFVYNRRYAPKSVKNYALGYIKSDSLNKFILPDDMKDYNFVIWLDGIVGDGCVNSTAPDLLKWDRALYTNKLLSADGMKKLFEVATLNDNSKTEYSFGWFVENDSEHGKFVSHTGSWPGYATFIERHVDSNKTIIVLMNYESHSFPVEEMRDVLYNRPLVLYKDKVEIQLPKEELEKLVGVYNIAEGVDMFISMGENGLMARMTGQNAFPIYAEAPLTFFLKVVEAQIVFEKDEFNQVSKLFLLQNGNRLEAKRRLKI
jgi:CubicO group peptidase (beta-lactamase class C family)